MTGFRNDPLMRVSLFVWATFAQSYVRARVGARVRS